MSKRRTASQEPYTGHTMSRYDLSEYDQGSAPNEHSLSSGRDRSRDGGGSSLGLSLHRLSLLLDLLSLGLLSGLGGLGLLSLGLLCDGFLLHGLLSRLLLSLVGGLALDGGTELGEGALGSLLTLTRGGLLALAKEGDGRLALLLGVLAGLAVGGGSDGGGGLSGLSRDSGGKRGGGLDRRDDGSRLSGGSNLLGGVGVGLSSLGLSGLLVLLGEDIAEEAVALGSLLLGALDGLGLLRLSLLSGGGGDSLLRLDLVGLDLFRLGLLSLGFLNGRSLRLGDSGGKLLGLSDLELQLGDPVVTLSGGSSLEAVLVALGSQGELVGAISLGLRSGAYQVDDAGRRLLVTNEQKTLGSLGGPGNVGVGGLGRLLGSLVGGKSLGLEGLGAKEEELLAGNQVPACTLCTAAVNILGEAQALGLVSQVTLLDGLDLLLLLLSLGLLSGLGRLGLLGGLLLGGGGSGGLESGSRGLLYLSLGSSSLDLGSLDGRGGLLDLDVLGDLDVLLYFGHREREWVLGISRWVSQQAVGGIKRNRNKENVIQKRSRPGNAVRIDGDSRWKKEEEEGEEAKGFAGPGTYLSARSWSGRAGELAESTYCWCCCSVARGASRADNGVVHY
ncbi:unnamed protein product [Clonostachys rosea]|uniref:Uncharacterized protein n=1 Tax=Bionectria ochroleuca TaxID=29856 RepID=A0ABY6UIG9_BIOOC|nr:unnamed protein product [Clonostachys rosea]